MVFYFKTRCGNYVLYMGKDKYENEDLIKYGQPEDVWFHVDDLSSAHVYLRMQPNQTLDDIPPDVLLDCGALVKANSIQGCKRASVYVIYTRWKNLKKTNDMADGAVSYHRPDNVRRFEVHKNSAVVKQLEKTRDERYPDLHKEQQDRLLEIQRVAKAEQKKRDKEAQMQKLEDKRRQEELSYDRIMDRKHMTSVSDMKGTVDASAAEEYEDDFF